MLCRVSLVDGKNLDFGFLNEADYVNFKEVFAAVSSPKGVSSAGPPQSTQRAQPAEPRRQNTQATPVQVAAPQPTEARVVSVRPQVQPAAEPPIAQQPTVQASTQAQTQSQQFVRSTKYVLYLALN
jgi:hypothetical protein